MLAPFHRGGSGDPLVLLHGLTASWRIWQPVLGELERHHDVFAPALAGHHGGPSLRPPDGGIPAICDALERAMDDAGIGVAHLVGSSFGGWAAIELARRGRGQSVVAFSPAGAWRAERDKRRLVRRFRLYDGRLAPQRERIAWAMRRPALRRLVLLGGMEHGDRMPLTDAMALLDGMIATTLLSGLAGWLESTPPYQVDLPADLPVRIAWGARDRTLPFDAYGAPWKELLPQAEYLTLPDCGHVPMFDDPALVARTILAITSPENPSD